MLRLEKVNGKNVWELLKLKVAANLPATVSLIMKKVCNSTGHLNLRKLIESYASRKGYDI